MGYKFDTKLEVFHEKKYDWIFELLQIQFLTYQYNINSHSCAKNKVLEAQISCQGADICAKNMKEIKIQKTNFCMKFCARKFSSLAN